MNRAAKGDHVDHGMVRPAAGRVAVRGDALVRGDRLAVAGPPVVVGGLFVSARDRGSSSGSQKAKFG